MRVNIEDDLHLSGRLTAMAKALGVSEDTAIGRLYWAYRETQHREMCVVSAEEFCEALALRVEDPTTLLAAMLKARLVSPEGDGFVIHGNETHIQRLQTLRGNAKSGGLARAKQMLSRRQADAKQKASNGQPSAKHLLSISEPSQLLAPSSQLLAPSSKDQIQELILLPQAPKNGAAVPSKKLRADSDYTPVHQVRLRYEALWASKFGKPYDGWSPKHASRAKALCGSPAALAETFRLLELFFEWRDPRVASSYSFCEGPFSFVMQRDALRARLAKPELDRAIGALGATQRQLSNEDAERLRYEEEMKTLRKGWDTIEAGVHALPSLVPQKPVKQPVKQLLGASLPLGGES